MEDPPEQNTDLDESVETLSALFGDSISKEVILAVLENCEGDLNLAAEIVMNMSSDIVPEEPLITTEDTPIPHPQQTTTSHLVAPTTAQDIPLSQLSIPNIQASPNLVYTPPTISYANAALSAGAVPKTSSPKPKLSPLPSMSVVWTDQLRQILSNHEQGARILIFVRGVPGSGKSHLARQIIEMTIGSTYTNFHTHIFSTDDFFMVRGQYQYEKSKLHAAHEWNHNRARCALGQGLSPVIIDNTNIEIWEMEPYLRWGVNNGYIIEVVEPNTPWAKKAYQLFKKTTHKVPLPTIRRMLDNYQGGITGADLIKMYGLSYPAGLLPPVLRTMPIYIPPKNNISSETSNTSAAGDITGEQTNTNIPEIAQMPDSMQQPHSQQVPIVSAATSLTNEAEDETEEEQSSRQKRFLEIQKQIEEMEKIDEEWENGEGWEDQESTKDDDKNQIKTEPLPPRTSSESTTPRENVLETVEKYDDWSKLSMFLTPWSEQPTTSSTLPVEIATRETISSSTCMEIGDADINDTKKTITASPRDINFSHIPHVEGKIPQMRMLDKSTTTNEVLVSDTYRCENEEHHFIAFRKLFKHIPRAVLRDVFDKCHGDVNWAVDIVFGSLADNQSDMIHGEESDTEVEIEEPCSCLAAYNVVPDAVTPKTSNVKSDTPESPLLSENVKLNTPQRKPKVPISESSLQLKRDIEKNIVLPDNHYSEHMLRDKKWRNGDLGESSQMNISVEQEISSDLLDYSTAPGPSTSSDYVAKDIQQTKDIAASLSDDESSNTSSMDDVEKTVNINLGADFVRQLDDLFGRNGMTYPENIVPRINIPISLLNEINAFWMESLMYQLDEQDKQNAKMLKEDAEFARQLAMKEAELAQEGKEPEVPDFKEIMDMDFAISLYHKDVAEWRNKEPNDIAAKLSRDKLYNLFPTMSPDILSELLMAHDNNFQATVEVLLMSTGKTDILEEKNGLNKFVMQKEMERQEKLLEEEKKTLSEVEWPLLPQGEKVEMALVNEYREEAEKHLLRRNMNYQKAQDYIRRGMTQVANYYSDVASFHKQKYEQANSLAAASLMQVHASNCQDNATIDLHYLRVGEARESLDLFLDTHIQKLRETGNKGVRFHTLFFITGRGLHSTGRPRVKPAVKKRLRERGLTFSERNPGLLTAKVCAEDKLSYQVQVP